MGAIFLAETAGTAVLILLGVGVVANVVLAKTKGFNGGWLMISFGWGLAVFAGVFVAFKSGAHLNPAVTLGIAVSNATEYASGVPINASSTFAYLGGQMLGAMIGAVLAWVVYKKHYDAETEPANILGTFSTGPEIRSYAWNFITEVIATFVLVFIVIVLGKTPSGLGPLAVAFVVVAIGASLGGPTGYSINPARDLGPRIVHALLPIPHKGSSDWSYAWVPLVGPLVGGALAGLASYAFV